VAYIARPGVALDHAHLCVVGIDDPVELGEPLDLGESLSIIQPIYSS